MPPRKPRPPAPPLVQMVWPDDFGTVYIDEPMAGVQAFGHTGWAHLVVAADTDLEVLHAFAKKLGLQRRYFQDHDPMYPHYDVTCDHRTPDTPSRWEVAVQLGAVVLRFHEGQTAAAISQRLIPCPYRIANDACGKPCQHRCITCHCPVCYRHVLPTTPQKKAYRCLTCAAQAEGG